MPGLRSSSNETAIHEVEESTEAIAPSPKHIAKQKLGKPYLKQTRAAVKASKEQVHTLNALYERATHPDSKSYSQAAEDTGLSERWIRQWFQRKRRNMKTQTVKDAQSTSASAPSANSEPTHGLAPGKSNSRPSSTSTTSAKSSKQLEQYQSTWRAHAFISVHPEHELPRPVSAPALVSSLLTSSTASNGEVPAGCMRAYTQSPSLGYIPVAFPFDCGVTTFALQQPDSSVSMQLSSAKLTSEPSQQSLANNDLASGNVSQAAFPSIPNIKLLSEPNKNPTNPSLPAGDSRGSRFETKTPNRAKSNSLYDLLFETADLSSPFLDDCMHDDHQYPLLSPPLHAFLETQDLNLDCSRANLSFEPSFQTHSTSVNAYQPGSIVPSARRSALCSRVHSYATSDPGSLAYRTSFYDLAALTKRVTTLSGPDVSESSLSGLRPADETQLDIIPSPTPSLTEEQYNAAKFAASYYPVTLDLDRTLAIDNFDPDVEADAREADDESDEAITPWPSSDDLGGSQIMSVREKTVEMSDIESLQENVYSNSG